MNNIMASEEIDLYEITTRPNLDKPQSVNGNGYNGSPLLDITNLYENCPDELAIVVHRFNTSESQAKERFDRVKMGLENNGGYIEFRSTENKTMLEDDGAINIIVDNWKKAEPLIKEYYPEESVKC